MASATDPTSELRAVEALRRFSAPTVVPTGEPEPAPAPVPAPAHGTGTMKVVAPPPALPTNAAGADCCELCHVDLEPRHEHLHSPDTHMLRCVCTACALLFAAPGARFARVVPRAEALPDMLIDELEWAALGVPVGLAFFCKRAATGEVQAFFPCPSGASAMHPPIEAWARLVEAHGVLGRIQPDVEALLVNRLDGAREHWRVSIDVCHKLIATVRVHWRGLGGGAEARVCVNDFFVQLAGGVHG